MLSGSFYSLVTSDTSNTEILRFQISFHPGHPIFSGHFPNQPVVPGVCLVQIGKELLGSFLGRKLFLEKSSSIKFLNVIDPTLTPSVWFEIKVKNQDQDFVAVDITVTFEAVTFVKFSGQFR